MSALELFDLRDTTTPTPRPNLEAPVKPKVGVYLRVSTEDQNTDL